MAAVRKFGNRQILVPAGAEDSDGEDCQIKFGSDSEDDDGIPVQAIKNPSGFGKKACDDVLDQGDATEEQMFFPSRPRPVFGTITNSSHAWGLEPPPPLPYGLEDRRFGKPGNRNRFSGSTSGDTNSPATPEEELAAVLRAVGLDQDFITKISTHIRSLETFAEVKRATWQKILPEADLEIRRKLEVVGRIIRENEWITHSTVDLIKIKYQPPSSKPAEIQSEDGPIEEVRSNEPESSVWTLSRILNPAQTFGFLKSAICYLGGLLAEAEGNEDPMSNIDLEETIVNLRNTVRKTKDIKERVFELQNLIRAKGVREMVDQPVFD